MVMPLLLFFLVGLPWNGLVIGIILKKKLFTRPTYMLMLNLAIANLLVCVLVLPLTVVTGFGRRNFEIIEVLTGCVKLLSFSAYFH